MKIDEALLAGSMSRELFEEKYRQFEEDPTSVEESWRALFQKLPSTAGTPSRSTASDENARACHVLSLINAYRTYGHKLAKTQPVRLPLEELPQELTLEAHGLSSADLSEPFPTFEFSTSETLPLSEIVELLQKTYCSRVGVQYMECDHPELIEWIQKKIEPSAFGVQLKIGEKEEILQALNRATHFEWFLQTKYVGQKRFSLEGGETLIPLLHRVLFTASQHGAQEVLIGMAHRGRLNVLSNILNKSYTDLFAEFEHHYIPDSFEGSGDVKYHKGFTADVMVNGKMLRVALAPNPSHLESVGPVLMGRVRAVQMQKDGQDGQKKVVPVLIHGDAALSGQGVIYETLQFSQLEGYNVGGTVHLVINNQIGFTTIPEDYSSTEYCTDIAKAFNAPVFHVNAEDPEACIAVATLATEIRCHFHIDVFINMNCYRKYGHNESDEPAYTQPLEYHIIRKKRSIREIYTEQLKHEGVMEKILAKEYEEEFKRALRQELKAVRELPPKPLPVLLEKRVPPPEVFEPVQTAVDATTLKELAKKLSSIPDDFHIHPKLQSLIETREKMVLDEAPPLDWGMAELLAYATLLHEKRDVRISGQDCRRGTFSHRHAVWVDQTEDTPYFPLQHLEEGQGHFEIYNSPLSEFAVLGFEYGYSVGYKTALVIWEAQFGDFCNGAQIIIDQYMATAEQKWGQKANLVLFLPHGFEGQGPEHSSARMERFLSLSGDENLFVVNPTTPAQLFHLLRRHMIKPISKPLIVFTPKGLLRHPACVSSVKDLTEGHFQEILSDEGEFLQAKRLVICTGKIYYDLIKEREECGTKEVAIVRLEQIYPLSMQMLQTKLKQYTQADEWIWVQEEPSNMGAWGFIRHKLQKLLPEGMELSYIGRERCSSPATGSFRLHKEEHQAIVKTVFFNLEKETK